MTPAIALLLLGGILLKAGFKNQNVVDVVLGRDTVKDTGKAPPSRLGGGGASSATVQAGGFADGVSGIADGIGRVAGKASIATIAGMAKSMGLHVGEHPSYGGVAPGAHTPTSWHYKGRAIDVSGDARRMQVFANAVDRTFGPALLELFWNGSGAVNRKNGKRVQKGFVSGHTDHVHVAV